MAGRWGPRREEARNILPKKAGVPESRLRALAGLFLVLALLGGTAGASAGQASPRVLILHDSSGPWGYLGAEYALMLRNLLGHFRAAVVSQPVSSYSAGQISSFDAVFYVGSTYDEPSFLDEAGRAAWVAFLRDASSPARPLIWIGHNLWHLAWGWDPEWGQDGFAGRFGFSFQGLEDGGYNRVLYKGVELYKAVVVNPVPGADLTGCSPEPDGKQDCSTTLGVVAVTDASRVSVLAEAVGAQSGKRAPYVTRSGNLWYVGDIPFSYISEEDRYLAFADLLHDMLGVAHSEKRLAMVRLEDVSPMTQPADLKTVASLLARLGVPFGVAVIPVWQDPLGYYSAGESLPLDLSPVADLLPQLWAGGASIVQHGTTHQWDSLPNPYTGASGDDFEFYRVTENADHSLKYLGPVPGDSGEWARERAARGREVLEASGILPFAFEAPHYAASATDYVAIKDVYPVHWGRVIYFPDRISGRFVGQFYPYVIYRDAYGQKVLPENLGNVEPQDWMGYPRSLPRDIIRRAEKARVVRDGFASFFFHPFLDPSYLEEAVVGIRALGYTFVSPCQVAGSCPKPSKKRGPAVRRAGGED